MYYIVYFSVYLCQKVEILTVNEVVREKINECIDAASDQFISSIRPVYGSTISGTPKHIGTCTLIEIDQVKYIVSAAHVFDESKYTSLYLGARSELELLEGQIYTTKRVDGERKNDHFDFAWMKIDNDLHAKLDNVDFIECEDISTDQNNLRGHFFVALGYPNSKNKKIKTYQKSITPKYFKYGSTVQSNDSLCKKLKISGDQHIFLPYDPDDSKDSEGNTVASIKPTGISGGGLIDMGIISKPKNLIPGVACVGKLAGILIEYHKDYKCMLTVKIDLIVNQIKKWP